MAPFIEIGYHGGIEGRTEMEFPEHRSEEEWRSIPEQFRVLRQSCCEIPFRGEHLESRGPGAYRCSGCAQILFLATGKYDSDCGWPAFFTVAAENRVVLRPDNHSDYPGVEVLYSRCGGHLGHGGQHYCINSVCLQLIADSQ